MSWTTVLEGNLSGVKGEGTSETIPFEINEDDLSLLKIFTDNYIGSSLEVVYLETNQPLTGFGDIYRAYSLPKKGKYSLGIAGKFYVVKYRIAVLNLSILVPLSTNFLDPFRMGFSLPYCDEVRHDFFLREVGQQDFVPVIAEDRQADVDPNKNYELKYHAALEKFPDIEPKCSPITTYSPYMHLANSFTFKDFLDLGLLVINFKYNPEQVKIYLEINIDGKRWTTIYPAPNDKSRTLWWILPTDIFDTLTRDAVIDWRFKMQSKSSRSFTLYTDTQRSLIRQRKHFLGKEFISSLHARERFVFERSQHEVDESNGYSWVEYDFVYWRLYLFTSGGFLFIKEAENKDENEFYRTGNFIVYEPNGGPLARRNMILYPLTHNGRTIRQLKFADATINLLVFSIKDVAQLILRNLTGNDRRNIVSVCRYFYEFMRNNGGDALEAEIKDGDWISVLIPALFNSYMGPIDFKCPKILEHRTK